MINGGTGIISSNVITDVLTDSSKMILKSDSFPLNPFKSKTPVIALQNEPTLSCDGTVRSLSKNGKIRINHGRIGTLIMNKNIWSVDDNSSVQSDIGEENKIDTSVQKSSNNEKKQHLRKLKKKS